MKIDRKTMAKLFDLSVLAPNTTYQDVVHLCNVAKELGCEVVCVNPCHARLAYEEVKNTSIKVCSVIAFPFGSTTPEIKEAEAKQAVKDGAQELDMVMNISALLSEDYELVEKDIRTVVAAASDTIVKVILETCLLTDDQKKKACEVATRAGARFVKTCTGVTCNLSTPEDVRLMKKNIDPNMEVKASAGIRDYETAVALIQAGATRLATAEQYVRQILAQCEEG